MQETQSNQKMTALVFSTFACRRRYMLRSTRVRISTHGGAPSDGRRPSAFRERAGQFEDVWSALFLVRYSSLPSEKSSLRAAIHAGGCSMPSDPKNLHSGPNRSD